MYRKKKMKEKKFNKWKMLCSFIIIGIFLGVNIIISLVTDNTLKSVSIGLTSEYRNSSTEGHSFSIDNLECHMDRTDLVELKSIDIIGENVFWTLVPTGQGFGNVFVEIIDCTTGNKVESTTLKVSKNGLITDMNTGNFSNFRERQLSIVMLMIAFTIILWCGYFKSSRELHYSYQSIFFIGLGIWVTIITILISVGYLRNRSMINLFDSLALSADFFMVLTFPAVLVFALLLSISNVSLIRHEGLRFQNVLGLLLSVAMVGGFVILVYLENIFSSGYEFYSNLWVTFTETLISIYVILECFLIGAIICGTKAARHKPAFDQDYIIILGCMIREDGTLFPLIRGRVDRAIRFYQDQLRATQKKAVFVPSGGKGANEPISEAEAMKRYLLEQGIEEDQILMEDQSKNTAQNMRFSRKLIGEGKKVVFSTTNFHVFRSGVIAREEEFDAEGIGSPTKWYFWPNAYIREVIGMISYKWRTLIVILVLTMIFLAIAHFGFVLRY